MVFALIGNQNSGKTTLFNQLTGSNQHVGNFPGVTVEKKMGPVKGLKDVQVVDLPGIYSLSPYTSEELVSRDVLLKDKPDAIIDIVDATNIERNLYLTLQLMELGLPIIVALNMMDEVRESGTTIDIAAMEKELGIPMVPIAANKNEGVDELIRRAVETAKNRAVPEHFDFCTQAVHKAIHSIAHIVEEKAKAAGLAPRFASTKLIEGDAPMEELLGVSEVEKDIIGHIVDEMTDTLGTDREAAIVDMRYSYIEELCGKTVKKTGESKAQQRSYRIDSVLTHKYLSIPIFIGVMATIFYLTFGPVGTYLADGFSALVDSGIAYVDGFLTAAAVSDWLHSLVIDGILAGVGSVLSFLPPILMLFFFLSILEDTGYMARVAFVMDRLLRKIGLSGHSLVPMLVGFGCSVPAIMAARTLYSESDRKISIFLVPFMSCGAKLPIYAAFTAAFFPHNASLVVTGLYVLGVIVAIFAAWLLRNTAFKGNPVPFIMELPAYRFPTVKNVMLHMWDKAKEFIKRAFTIIFAASVVIWFLNTFNWQFNIVADNADSILASIGRLIAPIFAPLGFGDWRASTALITGLTAKETVVSTLSVLTGATSDAALTPALQGLFSPLSAVSFLVFTLLYMPCVAALSATRKELGSGRLALSAMAFQTAMAWAVALVVFTFGKLLGLG
ncbi:MAG: ferrous iron transport protein B [Clostridiales bacterium]|nr:ferrous iron transport protein B [Clostridiales bacterium]